MPQVSVIIPTHNRPRLLSRAVESAKGAGREVEIVIVDDASTDETAEICRNLDGVTYVRLERNRGVAAARNEGVRASSGEFISFLDDDDKRLPGSLDAQARTLSSNENVGAVYGQVFYGDAEGEPMESFYPEKPPQGDLFWRLLAWNFVPCASVLFRRECLERVGFLDESSPRIDDWDLWIRIAEVYEFSVHARPVAVWRKPSRGSDQQSERHAEMLLRAARLFEERWMKLPRAAAASHEERRAARKRFYARVSDQLIWEGARALKEGRALRALEQLLAGLRLDPLGAARRLGRKKSLDFLRDESAKALRSAAREGRANLTRAGQRR